MAFPSGYNARRLRSQRWAILVILIAVALLLLRAWLRPAPPLPETLPAGVYQVQRVVDGDTLVLVGGQRVRLIGADTPETKHPDRPVEPWGPEATQFTEQFIGVSRRRAPEVRLEFDRDGPRLDQYDRLLAYVWVDGRMLNEELIRQGLAVARTEFPYSAALKARFLAAQAEAQKARRGIWSAASPVPASGPGRL